MVKHKFNKLYEVNDKNVNTIEIPYIGRRHYIRSKFAYWSDSYITLDTETSYKLDVEGRPEYCWVCSWQLCITIPSMDMYVYIGTDVRNLAVFLKRITSIDHLKDSKKKFNLRAFIHNISYDLEYLAQTFNEYMDIDVFVKGPHSYLNMKIKGNTNIEFTCTYQLTMKSLDKLSKDYDVYHRKQTGTYDYTKQHYSDEGIKGYTKEELKYNIYDVLALSEIVDAYMQYHPLYDHVGKIPYTQTGEVRDLLKKEFNKNAQLNFFKRQDMKPTLKCMDFERMAFWGGYVHSNALTSGQKFYDLKHVDRKSSYPDVMLKYNYPLVKAVEAAPTIENMNKYKDRLYIVQIRFKELKAIHGMPYLSYSKVYINDDTDLVLNNGKIVYCKDISLVCTNIDLKIISMCYVWDKFKPFYLQVYYKVGKLPEYVRNVVSGLFTTKETIDKDKYPMEYAISKMQLNATYGCMAQALDKPEMTLDMDTMDINYKMKTDIQLTKFIDKHFKRKHTVYAWAPFITAYARYELFLGMKQVGFDATQYCDTDSLFISNYDGLDKRISDLNERIKADSIKHNAYTKNRKGKDVYLGVWEFESDCVAFMSLHAKCYACQYEADAGTDNISEMTLAGVAKKNGDITREKEVGTFENFSTFDDKGKGFIFTSCGGKTCVHLQQTPKEVLINGHLQYVTSGGVIMNTHKQISLNGDELEIANVKILENREDKDSYSQHAIVGGWE